MATFLGFSHIYKRFLRRSHPKTRQFLSKIITPGSFFSTSQWLLYSCMKRRKEITNVYRNNFDARMAWGSKTNLEYIRIQKKRNCWQKCYFTWLFRGVFKCRSVLIVLRSKRRNKIQHYKYWRVMDHPKLHPKTHFNSNRRNYNCLIVDYCKRLNTCFLCLDVV